jgi:hypothetical protein
MNKLESTVHDVTHRVPGVPEHSDHAPGHQGATQHGASLHRTSVHGTSVHGTSVHGRSLRNRRHTPPRVMVGWQNWISSLFARKSE